MILAKSRDTRKFKKFVFVLDWTDPLVITHTRVSENSMAFIQSNTTPVGNVTVEFTDKTITISSDAPETNLVLKLLIFF